MLTYLCYNDYLDVVLLCPEEWQIVTLRRAQKDLLVGNLCLSLKNGVFFVTFYLHICRFLITFAQIKQVKFTFLLGLNLKQYYQIHIVTI